MSGNIQHHIDEAKRQLQICNACRYCEGYCNVFPSLHQEQLLDDKIITKLANMCHNCRGCYYACQYADPHEFNVNVPQALATLRQESWQHNGISQRLLQVFFKKPAAYMASAIILCIAFAIIGTLMMQSTIDNFYAIIPHNVLISIFLPIFIIPYIILAIDIRKFWHDLGNASVNWRALPSVVKDAFTLKNLNGGHNDGCNFEQQDIFTKSRKFAHHLIAYGFLLCFAATSSATILHYIFDIPAPYPLLSIPKALGLPGGIMMVLGGIWMIILKYKADRHLGATADFKGEIAFITLLVLIALSGLLLYVLKDFPLLLPAMLYGHLALVALLFIITPFSKFVHIFYRITAMLYDKSTNNSA